MSKFVAVVHSWHVAVIAAGAMLIASTPASADLFLTDRSLGVDAGDSGNATGGASGLTSGGSLTSNLGSFNIMINAGAGLVSNLPALAAFERAASRWEAFIADPITVNVAADLGPLGPSVLGTTNAASLVGSYNLIRNAMVFDASFDPDDGIVAALPATMSFAMPAGFSQQVSAGNPIIQLAKANAKALGFTGLDTLFGTSDGSITFSDSFAFDFDNSDGVTLGTIDFESVAAHEIGHLLGFFSDVDFIDFAVSQLLTSNAVQPTTLDMFRFDNNGPADPSTPLEFSTYSRSMIPGNDEITDQVLPGFGLTEVRMSTGQSQGDGRQASHWKDNLGLGLLDPTLAPGEISLVSLNDLRALDLIGYDIVAVPEASAWLFGSAALCIAGVGVAINRRVKARREA